MPPANTPSDTPVIPRSPPSGSHLPQLQELETPVPDLASTLTIRAGEEDVVEPRRPLPSIPNQMDSSTSRRRRPLSRPTADSDRWLRERLIARARSLQSSSDHERYSVGTQRATEASDSRSYGDRMPHWQSLYDWAPVGGTHDEDGDSEGDGERESARERETYGRASTLNYSEALREPTNGTTTTDSAAVSIPHLWMESTPPPLRSLRTSEWAPVGRELAATIPRFEESTTDERPLFTSSQLPEQSSDYLSYRSPQYSNLRSQAIAQAIRRQSRASQRPPRIEEEAREQLRQARLLRPSSMTNPSERRRQSASRDVRSSVDNYRQRYLQDPSSSFPDAGGSLEEVIQYLDQLRYSPTQQHSLALALEGGVIQEGSLDAQNHNEDLILNAAGLAPPPETSWLSVGSVFEGSQHATRTPNTITRRLSPTHDFISDSSSRLSIPSETVRGVSANRTSPNHPQTFTVLDPTAHDLSDRPLDQPSTQNKREDRWPVRVTIHSVDYSEMRLSGEMEAFNVPDGRSPDGKSSITTYLEGEIIDFNNHTLETKNYYSSAMTDGTYWRKLMPFRACADDAHLARCLVSKRWLADHISRDWILMRWKEKHFLEPTDQRLGLTISGFYYVSLRRSDGFVEGLYYDPSSAPYQHLVLRPPGNGCCDGDGNSVRGGGRRGEFPVYQFR